MRKSEAGEPVFSKTPPSPCISPKGSTKHVPMDAQRAGMEFAKGEMDAQRGGNVPVTIAKNVGETFRPEESCNTVVSRFSAFNL
jgi:hypothetical protein